MTVRMVVGHTLSSARGDVYDKDYKNYKNDIIRFHFLFLPLA